MSNKIAITDVSTAIENALNASNLDAKVASGIKTDILKQLRAAVEKDLAEAEENAEEKGPRQKKQWAIVVSDPNGNLPKEDFVGWVVQIPESESVATTLDRVHRATYDFNASKKGRLLPVKTVGEAFENIGAKYFKENELWVKSKIPVLVVKTNNLIPTTKTE